MVVCQYFLRGQCRFGTSCRNEHPKNAGPAFGNQSWGAPGAGSTTARQATFTAESIKKDLTPQEDKPLWPLSSYGPGKSEPTLIGGLDESPEELRFMAWQALKSGDTMQLEAYKSYEANKISAALAAHQNAHDNSMEAFKAAYQTFTGVSAPQPTTGFGQTTSSFDQPTQSTSAFGKPAFGQSAFGQSSTFGRPAFGQSSGTTSAFGQPAQTTSGFGQSSTSAFGQPQTTSMFGQQTQTSAFGQPAQPASAFSGQPTSAFGAKPAAFGQTGFGQPVKPPAFGQSAFGQAAPAFGQTGFGATRPAPAFGQTGFGNSALGQAKSASTFGTATQQPTSAFGAGGSGANTSGGGGFGAFAGKPAAFTQTPATSTGTTGGFGQTSGFGATTTQSAFGTGGLGSATPAFGAGGSGSAFGSTTPATTSAFGGGGSGSTFGGTAPGNGGITPFAFGAGGGGSSFGNTEVKTPAFGATPSGVSTTLGFGVTSQASTNTGPFGALGQKTLSQPDPGPKSVSFDMSSDPYTALLPKNYLEILPEEVKEAFKADEFKWGYVPEWTPPVELR